MHKVRFCSLLYSTVIWLALLCACFLVLLFFCFFFPCILLKNWVAFRVLANILSWILVPNEQELGPMSQRVPVSILHRPITARCIDLRSHEALATLSKGDNFCKQEADSFSNLFRKKILLKEKNPSAFFSPLSVALAFRRELNIFVSVLFPLNVCLFPVGAQC